MKWLGTFVVADDASIEYDSDNGEAKNDSGEREDSNGEGGVRSGGVVVDSFEDEVASHRVAEEKYDRMLFCCMRFVLLLLCVVL